MSTLTDDELAAIRAAFTSPDASKHGMVPASKALRLLDALTEARAWTDADQPLPEDDAIKAAHPMETDRHDTYAEAMRLVGAKRSKSALVDLVNWLLADLAEARAEVAQMRIITENIDAANRRLGARDMREFLAEYVEENAPHEWASHASQIILAAGGPSND